MKLDLNQLQNVHFIGIGGIGVSAVAKMMMHRGAIVTGSDATKSDITEELETRGIEVSYGHRAENLPANADLAIYSAAVPEDNPERIEARARGMHELSYFEFLGELSRDYYTIAVSGTNGKSTTTALFGLILEEAGLDPTVIVGSKVKSFPEDNLRLGKSKYLVVEACEYNAHVLKLSPQMIVLTNIEEDHLDYYQDLQHIKETFKQYINNLPTDGMLVYNSDDKNTIDICNANLDKISNFQFLISKLSYGIDRHADYVAKNIFTDAGRQYFDLVRYEPEAPRALRAQPAALLARESQLIGNFSLQVPGRFNIYNALAATTAAFSLNVDTEVIKRVLGQFTGIWRRFEKVGERDGAIIVSDYGHHPTAITETVKAAREFYPDRRIVLAFQPHQRNRTRKLFAEFVESLKTPDILILAEIYDVTGREDPEDAGVSSRQLFDEIRKTHHNVQFAKDLAETEILTLSAMKSNDLVIIMGAGDIDKVARNLSSNNHYHAA